MVRKSEGIIRGDGKEFRRVTRGDGMGRTPEGSGEIEMVWEEHQKGH